MLGNADCPLVHWVEVWGGIASECYPRVGDIEIHVPAVECVKCLKIDEQTFRFCCSAQCWVEVVPFSLRKSVMSTYSDFMFAKLCHPRTICIAWLCCLAPYVLVAWMFMRFTGGAQTAFWVVLSLLLGVRLAFVIMNCIGRYLYWRLHGRKLAVELCVEGLQRNSFPPRGESDTTIFYYLDHIEENPELSSELRRAAADLNLVLSAEISGCGLISGMRFMLVWDSALTQHTSRILLASK